jgi:hypothetical protein
MVIEPHGPRVNELSDSMCGASISSTCWPLMAVPGQSLPKQASPVMSARPNSGHRPMSMPLADVMPDLGIDPLLPATWRGIKVMATRNAAFEAVANCLRLERLVGMAAAAASTSCRCLGAR